MILADDVRDVGILLAWGAAVVLRLAGLYVALHFILKYW